MCLCAFPLQVLLGDPKFIQRMTEYDRDNVDAKVVNQVAEFMSDPLLEPETIQRVSAPVV